MRNLIFVAILMPGFAAAQSSAADEAETLEAIDEITVLGARSLGSMRAEVVRAEDVAFALFNELNDDDAYDIVCKKETRIGSQIPKRVCLARMYRDAVAEAAEDEPGILMTVKVTGSAKHQEILREKMRVLANNHPELRQALQQRLDLAKRFELERDRRYGD